MCFTKIDFYLLQRRFASFFRRVFDQDFYELVERFKTKWHIVDITNIVFYENKLLVTPIGQEVDLPVYIVNNSGITALNTDDNFCFFRCLSAVLLKRRYAYLCRYASTWLPVRGQLGEIL